MTVAGLRPIRAAPSGQYYTGLKPALRRQAAGCAAWASLALISGAG